MGASLEQMESFIRARVVQEGFRGAVLVKSNVQIKGMMRF